MIDDDEDTPSELIGGFVLALATIIVVGVLAVILHWIVT